MAAAETTTVVLVRHGHVPGIEPATFRGRSEIELTERGTHEARNTAQWIAQRWRPTIVYTSPRKRCIETGSWIARRCHALAQTLSFLDDLDYGQWQSRTHEDIERESPRLYERWRRAPHLMRFPGGESLQELVARAADALRWAEQRHTAQTIVMVGHDSFNRALLMHILGQPLSSYWTIAQAPCAINEISITDDQPVVLSVNQTVHLQAVP
jgi:broad specificity phosphatase PhoE